VSSTLAEGTQAHLPPAAGSRRAVLASLSQLYASWGYEAVEVPVLERFDPDHPRSAQAFTFAGRDAGLLALRSDFTPAVARLVAAAWPEAVSAGDGVPVRLQVSGPVFQALDPELARAREFHQIGVEMIGVRHPRADAELIHLARESVRVVGLVPRVEIGNPGYVKALMDEASVPAEVRPSLAEAIDRKDPRDVEDALRDARATGWAARELAAAPDLYGSLRRLDDVVERVPPSAARDALVYLQGVLREFEDDSELILDLGMARRLSYYVGVTFRAYTVDFGQPLLGGGRYDGAWATRAAGFAMSLERLFRALPSVDDGPRDVVVVSLDDAPARALRAAGVTVVRALTTDVGSALDEARALGAAWLLRGGALEAVEPASGPAVPQVVRDAERRRLLSILEGQGR
jgi:ATP phosphoribosyltransferase regulatory subunit